MSQSECVELLTQQQPSIVQWCSEFLQPQPQSGRGQVEFKRSAADRDGRSFVAVSDVADIEECIWSPRYFVCFVCKLNNVSCAFFRTFRFGLKGKVDVTVEIKVYQI